MFIRSPNCFHNILLAPVVFTILSVAANEAPLNSPPVAADDNYVLHGGGQIGSVLTNDFDADHDPLSPDIVTFPSHGQLFGTTNGSWNFGLTDRSYVGVDTFTYRACDSHQACSNVATVTVTFVNQPPIANDDSYDIDGNTVIGPFVANDSDPDGDPLTCGSFRAECILTFPQHGSLFGLTDPEKKTYSPAPGYMGSDSFRYNSCDSLGLCTPATVTLNISPPPTPTPTPTPTATPTPTPLPPPPPPSPSPTPTPVEPLIFVPGIAGSALDTASGENLWLGSLLTDRTKLSLNPARFQYDIVATDALRRPLIGGKSIDVYSKILEMFVEQGYKEYQVAGIPSRRTSAGCDLSQKRDDPSQNPRLFVFAYDWRRNITNDVVPQLADYIQCVREFHPQTKVNIVAHSMGGLVARRYILTYPNTHNVNKLMTIGTPWLGAPKAMYTMETGKFFANPFLSLTEQPAEAVLDYALSDTMKDLVRFFPGAHQLLPSRWYYDLGGRPFAENKWDINNNGLSVEQYSPDMLTTLLDRRYPVTPGSTARVFHDFAGQDDWQKDTSGVKYFHIYGKQRRNVTIGSMVATAQTICTLVPVSICTTKQFLSPERTEGDGTVPYISARRVNANGLLNLNNTPHRYVVNPLLQEADPVADHTGMTQQPLVWQKLLIWLNPNFDYATPPTQSANAGPAQIGAKSGSTIAVRRTNRRNSRVLNHRSPVTQDPVQVTLDADTGQATSHDPSYYVNLIGTGQVTVADAFGRTNAPIDDGFATAVPGVEIEPIGDDSFQVVASTSAEHVITFRSNGTPVAIEIIKGETNLIPTKAIRYLDLNLPNGVMALIRITNNGVENLCYDSDGDEVFETAISPTASVEGPGSMDLSGPEITVGWLPQQSNVSLSIAATDNESGLKQIYYSTDGSHYTRYVSAVLVNPVETSSVFVFADDHAGNRSTSEFVVPQPPVIMAPLDLNLSTGQTETSCGLTVSESTLGNASAVSNSSGTVTITRAGVPAGNLFPVGQTLITYTATDSNGLTATAVQTVVVTDGTSPQASCPSNLVAFLPVNSNSTSMAISYPAPLATDNCSGSSVVTNRPSGSVFPIGDTQVSAIAADVAGNSASCVFTVSVRYPFTGFFPPVNNLPVLNSVNAGRAIPVKFSLSGNKGLNIFASEPASGVISCDSSTVVEISTTLAAGNSSLQYDSSEDQYVFIWKTEESWAGTCRQLVIQLNDGTVRRANFKFK